MPGCLRRLFLFLCYIYYLRLYLYLYLLFTVYYLLFTVLSTQDYRQTLTYCRYRYHESVRSCM